MSLGSILVGLAFTIVAIVYIAQPFRKVSVNLDQVIESWIQSVRKNESSRAPIETPVSRPVEFIEAPPIEDQTINFCPQCGRCVEPDHRFCPGCGTKLLQRNER